MGYFKKLVVFLLSMFLIFGLSGYKFKQTNNIKQPKSSTSPSEDGSNKTLNQEKLASNELDLTDLDALTEKYLEPLYAEEIIATSWFFPNELNPDGFIKFYLQKAIKKTSIKEQDYSIPQLECENFIQQYFDVDTEHLRRSTFYNKTAKAYNMPAPPEGAYSVKVIDAVMKDDILMLQYKYDNMQENVSAKPIGTLVIRLTEKGYIYLECELLKCPTKYNKFNQFKNDINFENMSNYINLIIIKLSPDDYLGFNQDWESNLLTIKVVDIDHVKAVIKKYPPQSLHIKYIKSNYSLSNLRIIEQELLDLPFLKKNKSLISTKINTNGVIEFIANKCEDKIEQWIKDQGYGNYFKNYDTIEKIRPA